MIIRNKWRLILLLLPLLGVSFTYFLQRKEPIIIVDPISGFRAKQFGIILFTDSLSGGSSSLVLLDDTLNRLSYRYTLNNKVNAPLVRIIIESKTKQLFDLSSYNRMSITLKSDKAKQVPVIICNAIPFHSRPDEVNTYHLITHYAEASPEFKKQELALADFTTPAWWYSFDSNKEYQNMKPKAALVQYIFFTNSSFSGNFNEDTVTVSEWKLEYEFTGFFIRSGMIASLYYLFCFILFYFPEKMGVEKVYLWYKKIETVNYEEADANKIKAYLQDHFHNPELTIADVQSSTGIHQRKISSIIKKKAGLTFKAYLNQLRIEKAKALLSGTGLSISDIAFDCGYNSITHFNRVFKTVQLVSPQEFRLSQKSSD